MPTICIVIVSYNNMPYLRQAIESVLNQSRPPEEIIIADDGSTDGSRELIATMAKECSLIKPVFRDQNLGVAKNRDLAVKAAQSELVSTLDGDDFYSSEKLAREEQALVNAGGKAIAFSDIVWTDAEGKPVQTVSFDKVMTALKADAVNYLLNWAGRRPIPRDMLLPKDLWIAAGGQEHGVGLYEDWDLKIRLASRAPYVWSGTKGSNYRQHNTGLSRTKLLRLLKAELYVIRKNITQVAPFYKRCIIYTNYSWHCCEAVLMRFLRFCVNCKILLKRS